MRAGHILVETEEKAKDLKSQLDAGADFAALAAEHGTDGTAQRGGDLGWFVHSEMVPEFADAAFAMEPGTISDPVKSAFGWHLIKLDERRDRPAPALEEVKDALLGEVIQQTRNCGRSRPSSCPTRRCHRSRSGTKRCWTRPSKASAISGEADMVGDQSEKAEKLATLRRKQADIAAEIAVLEAELGESPAKKPGKKTGVSPLAPDGFPDLPPVAGVRLSSVAAGVRYRNRADLMLAELAAGSVIAGTFTRSETRSAPVLWCQERIAGLAGGPAPEKLAIVVNSGNANAFTGSHGRAAVEAVMQTTGEVLGISAGNAFMASTGVIGEPLPAERVTAKLKELAAALSPDGLEGAARAIMTTDTFPKGASTVVDLDGVPVTISGFAKGSGMIAPDMATMLVFIFTDAAIEQAVLQSAVSDLTNETFNAITVDSDTSTSDTLLVGATGQARSAKAGMTPIASRSDPRYHAFHDAQRSLPLP